MSLRDKTTMLEPSSRNLRSSKARLAEALDFLLQEPSMPFARAAAVGRLDLIELFLDRACSRDGQLASSQLVSCLSAVLNSIGRAESLSDAVDPMAAVLSIVRRCTQAQLDNTEIADLVMDRTLVASYVPTAEALSSAGFRLLLDPKYGACALHEPHIVSFDKAVWLIRKSRPDAQELTIILATFLKHAHLLHKTTAVSNAPLVNSWLTPMVLTLVDAILSTGVAPLDTALLQTYAAPIPNLCTALAAARRGFELGFSASSVSKIFASPPASNLILTNIDFSESEFERFLNRQLPSLQQRKV